MNYIHDVGITRIVDGIGIPKFSLGKYEISNPAHYLMQQSLWPLVFPESQIKKEFIQINV
jgi:hypothetical protein